LKKSILHRKNSLFYKTRNGAQMGDLFMSLIHTCELNAVNPFDYLNELQRPLRNRTAGYDRRVYRGAERHPRGPVYA
jgi:transposase